MERKLLAVALALALIAAFSAGMYLNEMLRGGKEAKFKVENLRVTSPSPYGKIYGRTPVTISVDVSNVGKLSGVKRVIMVVDNEVVAENDLPLVVGESKTFQAKIEPEEKVHEVGTHTASVSGLKKERVFEIENLPIEASVGELVHPRGVICRCARGRSARPSSPMLEVTITNEGSENMAPFRVVLKTPGGKFVEGGVIAQTKEGCSTGCARGNLQGETVYYVPISSSVVSPKAGKYELNVADYSVQGVWKKQINYSGSNLRVLKWGPVQFERRENGYVPAQGEVTVINEGDLSLSVAGMTVSVGGENLNGAVKDEPFVLPQEEKTLRLRFENHEPIQGGMRTAEFKLLKWVRRGGSRTVTEVVEITKKIEIK